MDALEPPAVDFDDVILPVTDIEEAPGSARDIVNIVVV